jgi:hypothetical protein
MKNFSDWLELREDASKIETILKLINNDATREMGLSLALQIPEEEIDYLLGRISPDMAERVVQSRKNQVGKIDSIPNSYDSTFDGPLPKELKKVDHSMLMAMGGDITIRMPKIGDTVILDGEEFKIRKFGQASNWNQRGNVSYGSTNITLVDKRGVPMDISAQEWDKMAKKGKIKMSSLGVFLIK